MSFFLSSLPIQKEKITDYLNLCRKFMQKMGVAELWVFRVLRQKLFKNASQPAFCILAGASSGFACQQLLGTWRA